MCIENLVYKEKVTCSISGTSGDIVFSALGFLPESVKFIVLLIKTTGIYTFQINDQVVTKTGTGVPEFLVLTNFELTSPNVYTLNYTCSELLTIYEINFATRCLCDPEECK
jgi:hypothetical protein